MGDTIPTEAGRAREKLEAALAMAAERTRGDEATGSLLRSVSVEEGMVYLFLDYGARGVTLSLPNDAARRWRMTYWQILEIRIEALCEGLVAWARSGSVPPRRLFWHV